MVEIPADAPRSHDGRYWWDGRHWQSVEEQAPPTAAHMTDEQFANMVQAAENTARES